MCLWLSLLFGLLSLLLDQGPIYSLLWWIGIEPASFLSLLMFACVVWAFAGLVIVMWNPRGRDHV